MSAVETDLLQLSGPWADGYVLEQDHTLRGVFLGSDSNGHARFDPAYAEFGQLLNQLKYRSDEATLGPIAATATEFVKRWGISVDALVSVPPSRRRAFQPVVEIVQALGAA